MKKLENEETVEEKDETSDNQDEVEQNTKFNQKIDDYDEDDD